MWCLRVINGPQAGQIYELKSGRNLIGRGDSCNFKVISNGVSKEHCEIHVYTDKVMVVDLRSSNGTYINGVKIQNGILRLGDKLSVHDVIFNIIIKQEQKRPESNLSMALNNMMPDKNYPMAGQNRAGVPQPHAYNNMSEMHPQMSTEAQSHGVGANPVHKKEFNLKQKISDYLDNVLMPGIYKLAQFVEFKYLILSFVAAFVFTVTLLNMTPAVELVNDTIQTEALRKTRSLARNLAQYNQNNFAQGDYAALNTDYAESEDGVKFALIVQQADGMILAPASKSGTTASIPKLKQILNENRAISFITEGLVISATPMGTYDPVRGEGVIKAFSIVAFDLKSRKVDSGLIISLFMQSLLVAFIVGFILYYFMIQLIEFPLHSLNAQIDTALKEKKEQTELKYISVPLQKLVSNINTLLTRAMSAQEKDFVPQANKDLEFSIMAQSINQPILFLTVQGQIVTGNKNFEQLSMLSLDTISGSHFNTVVDPSLAQNIEYLQNKAKEVPAALHSEAIEFNQLKCMINCQALLNESSEVAYYMISFSPLEQQESEGAA